jgi:hypothetical protein
MKIFFMILAIIVGAILIVKTEWFMENIGRIDWAEQHLGAEGGSRLMYKLIGFALIIISFLVFTGGIQAMITSIFGPLLGGLNR